jgi:predicted phage tail component-like protein
MHKNTVEYNGVNLYDIAFLRVFSHNVFSPEKKARKLEIETRSGAYDYGAKFHKERAISVECLIERPVTTGQFDGLKWLLSKKGRIVFWDEPDRDYYGEFYGSAQVLNAYNGQSKRFTLDFVCEPYGIAYDPVTKSGKITDIKTNTTAINMTGLYGGTRAAPMRITVRNTGTTAIQGLKITVVKRK